MTTKRKPDLGNRHKAKPPKSYPNKTTDPDRLLTIDEAARRLAVSVATVRRLIGSGRLRIVRLTDRVLRIRPRDLETFLKSATQ